LFDITGREALEACSIASGDQFGERGSGRDGSRAPANFEPALNDPTGFDEAGQAKDIAADGVRNLDRNRGRRQFTDVARIPEMLNQFR